MSARRVPTLPLIAATGLAIAAALWGAFLFAPTERTMGDIQRIFYFHVAAGMIGISAFLAVLTGSVAYIATRNARWDRFAEASAEVGLLYTTIVLVTGPIWAKPVWGVWWTWDARLTSTLVLWFIYWSYLLVRSYVAEPSRRALLSSVVGVIGSIDAPIVYFSIRWWRTQHPSPVIGGGEGSGLAPPMRQAWLIAIFAFLLLFALLVTLRARLAEAEEDAFELGGVLEDRRARGSRVSSGAGGGKP